MCQTWTSPLYWNLWCDVQVWNNEAATCPHTLVNVCVNVFVGRVKTLHPAVHGGILAIRDNKQHMDAIAGHKIQPIDLVGL
jgi:hypothetical protein